MLLFSRWQVERYPQEVGQQAPAWVVAVELDSLREVQVGVV